MIALIRPLVSIACCAYMTYTSYKAVAQARALDVKLAESELHNVILRNQLGDLRDVAMKNGDISEASDVRERLQERLDTLSLYSKRLLKMAELATLSLNSALYAYQADKAEEFVSEAGTHPFDQLSDEEVQDILIEAAHLAAKLSGMFMLEPRTEA